MLVAFSNIDLLIACSGQLKARSHSLPNLVGIIRNDKRMLDSNVLQSRCRTHSSTTLVVTLDEEARDLR